MKTFIFCCLSVIVLVPSLAYAQSVTRCGGPSNALSINWPMFQFDVCHTGYNPYEKTVSSGNLTSLRYWWTAQGSGVWTSLVVVNGMILYRGIDGYLYADNAQTGQLIWKYYIHSNADFNSSPAVANGIVYIGGNDYNLYAIDAATGILRWTYTAPGTIGTATVANGTIYFGTYEDGTNNGHVFALNASTGALLWHYGGPKSIASSPAVVNGLVYVGSKDGNLYAFNAVTGALLWKYHTLGPIVSSPTVFNGVVYFGSDDSNVYALNATTGALKWTYKADHPVEATAAIANGVIYVSSGNYTSQKGTLYALDAATGTPQWLYSTNYSPGSPLALANGVVYATSFDGTNAALIGIDALTGALLWNAGPQETSPRWPVLVNGVLYYSDSYFGVRSFHLPN